MDSLLLVFLLFGAAPDGPSVEAPRSQSRAHAVASATIVRGEVISFGEPAGREAASDGSNIFRIAPPRSEGEIVSVEGLTIRLQEFH